MQAIPIQIPGKTTETDLEDYELEQWRIEYGKFRQKGEAAIDRAFEINHWGAAETEARRKLCTQSF